MAISKKILHQTLACSPVILNQVMVGLGWGWTAPTLIKLQSEDAVFRITADQASWLASINEIGRVFGPFISPLLVDNIGRKHTLVLISIMYFVVWSTTIFARNMYILCLMRILFGIANGINDVVAGIYTTENCSPNFRGIIGGVIGLMFSGALFIEYILATYLSYVNTAIVNTVISSLVFGVLYFGVETPHFLVMKGKHEKAEKNLIWLQGSIAQIEVADELAAIKHSVQEEKEKQKSVRMLFAAEGNLRSICVVTSIYMLLVSTGSSAFCTYASLIFVPSESLSPNQFTILYGIVQFIAVTISPFIVERLGRRTLIIACFMGVTMSNICSYVLVCLHTHGYQVAYYPWLIFASIGLYGTFGSLMAPATYAIKGELLPLSVRAIGSSIAVTGQSIASFLVAKAFFSVTEQLGMETNFLMYAVMSVVTTVSVYYTLPETRGKSLHEIQNALKSQQRLNDLCDSKDILKN